MSEVWIGSLASILSTIVGGFLVILSNHLINRNTVKEKQRIEAKEKFDMHSRIFRRINYHVDRYLDSTTNRNLNDLNEAGKFSTQTIELMSFIESIDDSLIKGEGIDHYYAFLYILRSISNNIFSYIPRLEGTVDEYEDVEVNVYQIASGLTELREFNEKVKIAQKNK